MPYFIVVLGAFFALAAILWLTRDDARPKGVGAARAAERATNREEVEAAQADQLKSYAVVNAEKGIYQIPIDKAVETMIREWKQPEAALKRMGERVDLAVFVPPPPPEAPSEFE